MLEVYSKNIYNYDYNYLYFNKLGIELRYSFEATRDKKRVNNNNNNNQENKNSIIILDAEE